ncbi:MAG TPA: YihY/virulence factor BrkB family protein [Candidatus Thermoplasmatota archaeon]|nr:YihY/virulence factor BrkB family protein [Candidatus Thermoplasmatota archaeon]
MAWRDRAWYVLARGTVKDFVEDKAARLGAALAYYTVFSLAPLLVIVVGIVGLFLGQEAAQGSLLDGMARVLGPDGAEMVRTMLSAGFSPGAGWLAATLGVLALLFGATGVVAQLKDALNTIWEVKPKPGRGLLRIVRTRVLSLGMVLAIGFLLLVSLVVSAGLAALGTTVRDALPGSEAIYFALNVLIALVVTTALFALLFRFLPDVKVAWRDVTLGAFVTALLFNVGQALLGLYLARAGAATAYGAAGSLVVILLWVFYSAQIFFLGAEFTQVYANRYGSRVRPSEDAEPISEDERLQQGMEPRRRGRRAG